MSDSKSDFQGNWELDETRPMAPQMLRILRERIIHNDIKPGTQFSETEIAREYDISRQPVREAFSKLADSGLVLVRPQRRTVVNKISYAAVLEARFIREAIEADIVTLLAQQPDAAVIKDLREQMRRQSDVTHSATTFIGHDERFHRTLAEAAGKAGAWRVIERLKYQMDRVRILRMRQFPLVLLIQQHTAIVDAIESGDPTRASATMRSHLREILQVLPDIYAENKEFFDGPDPNGSNKSTSTPSEEENEDQ